MSEVESKATGLRIRVPTGETLLEATRCFMVGANLTKFFTDIANNKEVAEDLAPAGEATEVFSMMVVDVLEDGIKSCGVNAELGDALGALRRNIKNRDVEGIQTSAKMALNVLEHK